VRALRRLYAPGAGQADTRLLRRYLRRGLVVEDLRVQVLSFRLRVRTSERLVARVTSRTLPIQIRERDGRTHRLPQTHAQEQLVELRPLDSGWVVQRVSAPG
jgi:hypothetical protein